MASVVMAEDRQVESAPVIVRWGAIFSGAFVTLGVWVLLYAFGLAVGLSSVDPNNPSSARAAGIGTGVWSLVAPLIALFVGGIVASYASGSLERSTGVLHGLIMWGLTTIAGVAVAGMVIGSVVSGLVSVGAQGVSAAASTVAGAAQGGKLRGLAQTLGVDEQTVMEPLNAKLRADGKPEITAGQLSGSLKSVIRNAVQTGQLNREQLVSAITANTPLSRAEASDVADSAAQKWQQQRGQLGAQLGQLRQKVESGALTAADRTGKMFWGVFGALLLGLISALLGAMVGHSRRERHVPRAPGVGVRRARPIEPRPIDPRPIEPTPVG